MEKGMSEAVVHAAAPVACGASAAPPYMNSAPAGRNEEEPEDAGARVMEKRSMLAALHAFGPMFDTKWHRPLAEQSLHTAVPKPRMPPLHRTSRTSSDHEDDMMSVAAEALDRR